MTDRSVWIARMKLAEREAHKILALKNPRATAETLTLFMLAVELGEGRTALGAFKEVLAERGITLDFDTPLKTGWPALPSKEG